MKMDNISLATTSAESKYSALDFALIALLENIKHEVLDHKIKEEWDRLFISYKRNGKTRDIRKQQNLAAGLLNIWEWLSPADDELRRQQGALERFVWDGEREDFNEARLYEILKYY